jgi:hypothetical protein
VKELPHKGGKGDHRVVLSPYPKASAQKLHAAMVKQGKEMKVPIPKAREIKPNQVILMEEGDFKQF